MNTSSRSIVVLGIFLSTVLVGVPASSRAQTPPPPPPAPALPPPPEVQVVDNALLPRVLPERVALVPTIPPFTKPLTQGDSGEDVRNLQRFLNQHGFLVAQSGPGAAGQETTYYGTLTRKAVARYQEAYAAFVLAPVGTTNSSGVFGPKSLTYANELMRHGFVNMFPKDTAGTQAGQLAAVATSGTSTMEAFASVLAAVKQQVENIKNLLPSISQ